MPELKTTHAITTAIRAAIRSRDHWIIATDAEDVVVKLIAFANLLRDSGVPDAEIRHMTFVVERKRKRFAPISVLILTKAAIPYPRIRDLIKDLDGAYSDEPMCDIFVQGINPQAVAIDLDRIRLGTAQLIALSRESN